MNERRAWLGQVPLVRRPSLGGSSPITVTDATFAQVLAAPMAIVDFWSPECPYCVTFKPIFEEVAAASDGKILMYEAQVDDDATKTAGSYNIKGLPAVIFFANGKEVNRVEGSMSKADYLTQIAKAFGAGAAPALPAGSQASAAPAGVSSTQTVLGGLALLGILGGAVYMAVQAAK